MAIDISIVEALTEQESDRLFKWGEDIFGVSCLAMEWRPKRWHILLKEDGRPVSHVGVLEHQLSIGDEQLAIGGIGAVSTVPEAQGKGYASQAMESAHAFMRQDLAADFGLLFCIEHMVKFYQRLGWRQLEDTVVIEQPSGQISAPFPAMYLPLRKREWPPGAIKLDSLPW